MPKDLGVLSASDLAIWINVSPGYIARLCRKGEIPATKLGSTWLIRKEDADMWLKNREKHQSEH